jgi:hypothetical protein
MMIIYIIIYILFVYPDDIPKCGPGGEALVAARDSRWTWLRLRVKWLVVFMIN